MSLRDDLIEAIVEAMPGWDYASAPMEEHADAVLDAVLDTLADRADEWDRLAAVHNEDPPQPDNWPTAYDFIAVLRGDTE